MAQINISIVLEFSSIRPPSYLNTKNFIKVRPFCNFDDSLHNLIVRLKNEILLLLLLLLWSRRLVSIIKGLIGLLLRLNFAVKIFRFKLILLLDLDII